MPDKQDPFSTFFAIEELASGIYVALGRPDGVVYSNTGIIDLGGRTLVFDAFNSPQAGEELAAAALSLTGRRHTWLVNSHMHLDHWAGNQAFVEDATIIATARTRESMPESSAHLRQYQDDPSRLEKEIQAEADSVAKETDPLQKKGREISLSRRRHLHAVLPNLRLTLPDLTFEEELVFHGTRRSVRLVEHAPGHTPSDTYLVLLDEGIVFTGDLAFFAEQPYMGSCDPEGWLAWHDEADMLDAEIFVPGHGPLGTKEDLSLQRRYIVALTQMIDGVIAGKGRVEDALAESLPPPFDVWIVEGRGRFEINVRTLFEQRLKRQSAVA